MRVTRRSCRWMPTLITMGLSTIGCGGEILGGPGTTSSTGETSTSSSSSSGAGGGAASSSTSSSGATGSSSSSTSGSSSSTSASGSSSSGGTGGASSSSTSGAGGGTTSSSGAGGGAASSSSGGTGGCVDAASCPGNDTECATRTCSAGGCGVVYAAAGTKIAAQVPGDCQALACDGAGGVVALADAADAPDDGLACTVDACAGSQATHVPVAAGTPCAEGGGKVCNGAGACVACVGAADCPGADTECSVRTCTAGVCGVSTVPAGGLAATQKAGDCATSTCNAAGAAVAQYDAADAAPGQTCPSSTWQTAVPTCGGPIESAPATSWTDCGVPDPTKQGGDLLWLYQDAVGGIGGYGILPYAQFPFVVAAGPTGDIVVGGSASYTFFKQVAVYLRLNAGGARLATRMYDLNPSWSQSVSTIFTGATIGPTNDLFASLAAWCQGSGAPPTCPGGLSEWNSPTGAVIPAPSWVSPLGALKTASGTAPIDLGCGALPAAPGGSTFVTRIDSLGNCLYARSFPLPGLKAVMDASGRVVVSGYAGAGAVDLGGGPLAQLDAQDMVLVELDPAGNHLWSRRMGGAGAYLFPVNGGYGWPADVTISAAGNVYLVTNLGGPAAVDFGGGVISAAGYEPIVASYTPSGAHRWSRAYHFGASVSAAVDGCGSLVVASRSLLRAGCSHQSFGPVTPAIARFAP